MLRITEYIKDSLSQKEIRKFSGNILIWNITNLCNLQCRHCYADAHHKEEGELSLEQALALVCQIKRQNFRFAIISGGEPLARKDVFQIADALKDAGIMTYLSSNGLLVKKYLTQIKQYFPYVGISIDGTPEIHDQFRGRQGSFEGSLEVLRACRDYGLRVGLRFTLTSQTYDSLPFIFELVERENIPKIYISHLVYSGRAKEIADLEPEDYRKAVEFILNKAFYYVDNNKNIDIVTGNNEADAALLLERFKEKYPKKSEYLHQRLKLWGGNQAGVRMANIDPLGFVKPDPFFPRTLGNVKEKSLDVIWSSNGILSDLRQSPRNVQGKCEQCPHLEICNGNSRARAYSVRGDLWGEDPACYL